MRKFLVSETAFKIYSVLIALVLWGFVVITQNPISTKKIYSIDVYCSNADALEQAGLAIYQSKDLKTSVTVSGKRLSIAKVDASNITATYTVPEIKAGTYEVPIDVRLPLSDVNVSDKSSYTANIVVEERQTKELPIQVSINGLSAEEKAQKRIVLSADTITLSGPTSVISKVNAVSVTVNKSDIGRTVRAELVITDDAGKVVTQDSNVKKPFSAVSVTVSDLSSIPQKIEPNIIGQPANGYKLVSAICAPERVLVGTQNNTAELPKVETEPITIDGLTRTTTVKAKIVVPEGYDLLEETTEVEVTLTIEPVVTKRVSLNSKDIVLKNKNANKKYRFESASYAVTVSGAKSAVEKDVSLSAEIDADKLGNGIHVLYLDVKAPAGVVPTGRVAVKLIVETK